MLIFQTKMVLLALTTVASALPSHPLSVVPRNASIIEARLAIFHSRDLLDVNAACVADADCMTGWCAFPAEVGGGRRYETKRCRPMPAKGPCRSSEQCSTGSCDFTETCAKAPDLGVCSSDYECVSGSYRNGKCRLAAGWPCNQGDTCSSNDPCPESGVCTPMPNFGEAGLMRQCASGNFGPVKFFGWAAQSDKSLVRSERIFESVVCLPASLGQDCNANIDCEQLMCDPDKKNTTTTYTTTITPSATTTTTSSTSSSTSSKPSSTPSPSSTTTKSSSTTSKPSTHVDTIDDDHEQAGHNDNYDKDYDDDQDHPDATSQRHALRYQHDLSIRLLPRQAQSRWDKSFSGILRRQEGEWGGVLSECRVHQRDLHHWPGRVERYLQVKPKHGTSIGFSSIFDARRCLYTRAYVKSFDGFFGIQERTVRRPPVTGCLFHLLLLYLGIFSSGGLLSDTSSHPSGDVQLFRSQIDARRNTSRSGWPLTPHGSPRRF
ncbi:hypothetical protein V8E36_000027 [Tilletia maclaganii]